MEAPEYDGDDGDIGMRYNGESTGTGFDGDIQNAGDPGHTGNNENDGLSHLFWDIDRALNSEGLESSGDISHGDDGETGLETSSGTGVSAPMSRPPSASGSALSATVSAGTPPARTPNPDQTTSTPTRTFAGPSAGKGTSSNERKQCNCRKPDAPKCNALDSFRRCLEKVNPRNEWGVAFAYCDNCIDKECHKNKRFEPAIRPLRCRCGWSGRSCRVPASCLGEGTIANEGPNLGYWCASCAITCSEESKRSCTCAVTSYRDCVVGSEVCTKIFRGQMTSPLRMRFCAACRINGCCKED